MIAKGQDICLTLYTETVNTLWDIGKLEAETRGEAQLQVLEGHKYIYDLTEGFRFEKADQIIIPSPKTQSEGRIEPGLFVGTLILPILDQDNQEAAQFELEVRSTKTSYREDYRFMLEDIADHSTTLILQSNSPALQRLTFDFSGEPETDYQRFAFIRSMLHSAEFDQAVQRILSQPASAWSEIQQEHDVRNLRRLTGRDLRSLASGQNRMQLPEQHPLKVRLSSLPTRITTTGKIRILDTPENRFIKHALAEFLSFCSAITKQFENSPRQYQRATKEAQALEEYLADLLNRDFFRALSYPNSLPLNSPTLQRKEGYRDILRIWLLFDLAARLIWKGGEDVYQAGKRDVAQLYEYWLFFILKGLVEDVFSIPAADLNDLFEITNNNLDLKLKSGIHTVISGEYPNPSRKLMVEFSYNRTFSGHRQHPQAGSWTQRMVPDYTLSLWPADINKNTAEGQELITHIHFDAKYRVENIQEILGENGDQSDTNSDENGENNYQPTDLLKMHAYKDAIRRTAGAYVIYPGAGGRDIRQGFHEIIPGLGAFAIRPSRTNNGAANLRDFLEQVADHLLNRAAQRDQLTYHTYEIFKEKASREIKEPLPEFSEGVRVKPPAETAVLVGYCKSEEHYHWIKETGLYNFRLTGRGAISEHVDPKMLEADYLLLHWQDHSVTGEIYKIKTQPYLGPKRMTGQDLLRLGYPNPGHEEYLVFEIEPNILEDFSGAVWNLQKLAAYGYGGHSGIPFAVTLTELMWVKE